MRSAFLIIGSAVFVAIAFCIYLLIQAAPAAPNGTIIQAVPTSAPVITTQDAQSFHAGTDPWLKSFDGNTEFRATSYYPHQDGVIDMIAPQARFFLGGGALMTIDGETGYLVDPNSTGGKMQGQSLQPTRGKMQHVVLKKFNAVGDAIPQFTCWLNNISFDNETFTIVTDECDIPDAAGRLVHTAADEVPVHMIGIDYDFDGRGLYIKYDERDRKLQRLEIAHGEKLVIKHPSDNGNSSKSVDSPLGQAEDWSLQRALRENGILIQLASADPLAGGAAINGNTNAEQNLGPDAGSSAGQNSSTSSPTTRALKRKAVTTRPVRQRRKPASGPATQPTSAPVIRRSKDATAYRATFFDNVHVTQLAAGLIDSESPDQATVATADRMNTDFYMGGETGTKVASASTAASSTQGSTQGSSSSAATSDSSAATQSSSTANIPPRVTTRASAADRPRRSNQHPVTRPLPVAVATTLPSTKPSEPPLVVRWTGKLIIIPMSADLPPLAAGDSGLELVGDSEPAVLNRAGTITHCASFQYHTLHQMVAIRNSPSIPQATVVSTDGTRIIAPAIDYDGADLTAEIGGPAHAEFKVTADSGSSPTSTTSPTTFPSTKPSSIALVDWADHCHLQMKRGERENPVISEAVLDGDVHVDHPQVKLISDELDLGFDEVKRATTAPTTAAGTTPTTTPATHPSSTTSELRRMDSSGDVDCTLVDAQGKNQHILAEHLTLDTAKDAFGQVSPSRMTADGDVQTFNDTQRLSSGYLIANLEKRPERETILPAAAVALPSTMPRDRNGGGEVKLKSLFAQTDVHFLSAAGDFANADQLLINQTPDGESQIIDLFGQPTASVGDKETTITGPIVRYDPGGKQARVLGEGTLESISAGADKSTTKTAATQPSSASTRPTHIEWSKGLNVDGMTNRVRINGDVHTHSLSNDGTVNTADGDHIIMTLVDMPATQPATQPTTKPAAMPTAMPIVSAIATQSATQFATTQPTSKPSPDALGGVLGGPEGNFMKNKQVSVMSLYGKDDGDVVVKSELRSPADELVRALDLLAPIVNYDKINDRLFVPVPGRMLVRDFAKDAPSKANGGGNGGSSSSSNGGGMKGTTAFQWTKDLIYDRGLSQAIMTGDTHVVHEASGAAGYEMFADKIVTDMEAAKPTTRPTTSSATVTAPATAPATQPSNSQSLKVKRMTAIGAVRMLTARMQITAGKAIYDPQTQVMTAIGSTREPVQVYDNQGVSTGSFDEVEYNMQSGLIKRLKNANTSMNR